MVVETSQGLPDGNAPEEATQRWLKWASRDGTRFQGDAEVSCQVRSGSTRWRNISQKVISLHQGWSFQTYGCFTKRITKVWNLADTRKLGSPLTWHVVHKFQDLVYSYTSRRNSLGSRSLNLPILGPIAIVIIIVVVRLNVPMVLNVTLLNTRLIQKNRRNVCWRLQSDNVKVLISILNNFKLSHK